MRRQLIAALTPVIAGAQSLEPRPLALTGVEAFSFQSAIMNERYEVVVAAPQGMQPGVRYGALIVTDGSATWPVAWSAVRALAGQGDIDPMFVVSIGLPNERGEPDMTRRRVREFSPPGWDYKDPFGQLVSEGCKSFNVSLDRCTGGAPQFLQLITSELLPGVLRRFPIDTTKLTLFGLSAGGFFTSWVMFQPNSPFRNYIISSPATAYGNGAALRLEAEWAKTHKDFPVGVYVSSGSLEMDDPRLEGIGRIVSGQMQLVAALRSRNYPSLRMFTEIHNGLGHSDVAHTALVRGLRTLLPRTASPTRQEEQPSVAAIS